MGLMKDSIRQPQTPQKRMIGKMPTWSHRSDELWGSFPRRPHVDNFPQGVDQTKTNTIAQRPVYHR